MTQEVPPRTDPTRIAGALRKGPLGLIIGLAILGYCGYRIGPEAILISLRQVRPAFLAGGLVLIFCWLLLGALNIRTMLNPLAKVPYAEVLRAYSNANMVALIMPGQVGDVVIVKFFKDMNIPLSQGLTLFAADKIVTLFWYAVFAFYGLYLARLWEALRLPLPEHASALPLTLASIAVLGLALLFFSRHLLALASLRIRNWLSLSRAYLQKARNAVFLNILITLVRVGVMGCAYWVTIKAYGPSPTFMQALSFAITAGLVAYIPVSFNGLGTVEAALVYLYSTIGIESAPVLSSALTMRLQLILVVIGCAATSSLLHRNAAKEKRT